jgi:hypothetical protein
MAAKNIDGTNDGSGIYNTKIPGYEDAADIQDALRLYHYGSSTIPETTEQIAEDSIAGYLKVVESDIQTLFDLGYGAAYQPEAPTGVTNGYIWVDSNSSALPLGSSFFQEEAPISEITVGTLWVDSDSSPLKLYVYDGSIWREIGA